MKHYLLSSHNIDPNPFPIPIQTNRSFGIDISNICPTLCCNHQIKQMVFSKQCSMQIQQQPALPYQYPSSQQYAKGYFPQIFAYLLQQDGLTCQNYFLRQTDITEYMRSILIDWLLQIQIKLKLSMETVYLTVDLIDRFLDKRSVSVDRLQLVGVSALYVGSKYQEVYRVPSIKDLAYLCANAYKKEQILCMQSEIISVIEFKIYIPMVIDFLNIFSKICSIDIKNYHLCSYLCELALLDFHFRNYPNSHIAYSVLYLVNKIRSRPLSANQALLKISIMDQTQMKHCAKLLCTLLQTVNSKQFNKVVKSKYESIDFMQVAKIRIQKKKK